MKNLIRLLICLSFLSPLQSFAKFKSKNDLLMAFVQTGYEHFVELPGNLSGEGPDIKIHAVKGGQIQLLSLQQFIAVEPEKRLPELDYVQPHYLTEYALHGETLAEAYQVSDMMVCYKIPRNVFMRSRIYSSCFVFPVDIQEIVLALKANKKIR